jgi:hypothetical protein
MLWAEACFCCVAAMRPFPGSACDENTSANVIARQKASRNTALNRFMILFLLSARQPSANFILLSRPNRS